MFGTEDSPGIVQLAVTNIFKKITEVPDRDFLVRVSYIEIYNEKLIDLLNRGKNKITVRDTLQGVKVDATSILTSSFEEMLQVMKEGEANRQIGATLLNEESSRSHTIFQITIESREHIEGEEVAGCANVSTLNLVDLAGSERYGQTGATVKRFKEGTHINKSLSTLALVIKQLSEGPHKFANRAKAIKNKPKVNAVATDATKLQGLTKQLPKLQMELAAKNHIEEDNLNLQKEIAGLQKMTLNGFGQQSPRPHGCRRKTWRASCRQTVFTLDPLDKDKETKIPKSKYNPMPLPKTFQKILKPSQLAPISEETVMKKPAEDTKDSSDDLVIISDSEDKDDNTSNTSHCSSNHKCYSLSKTPPRVLREDAKTAEKIVKEKMISPEMVEYYKKKLKKNIITIARLKNDLRDLDTKSREKDFQMVLLKDKIKQTEKEIEMSSSAKAELEVRCKECETKITDLEVSHETFKMKAKLREDDLLYLLDEQTSCKKPGEHGKSLSRTLDRFLRIFMNWSSKHVSLVSDNDSGIDNSHTSATLQFQDLFNDMKQQTTAKIDTIDSFESDLLQQKLTIETLENTCKHLQKQVTNSNSELEHINEENACLKSSIETLNSTIGSQKENLETANNDMKSYTSVIQELQVRLLSLDKNKTIINKLKQDNEALVKNKNDLSRKLLHAEKQNLKFEKQNIELQSQNEEYKNQLCNFKANHDKLLKNLKEYKNTISKHQIDQEEFYKLQNDVIDKDNIITKLKSEIVSKDNLIISHINERVELQKEVESKNNCIDKALQQDLLSKKEIDSPQALIKEEEEVHIKVITEKEQLEELTQTCTTLQKDYEKLTEDAHECRMEVNELKNIKESFESDRDEGTSRLSNASARRRLWQNAHHQPRISHQEQDELNTAVIHQSGEVLDLKKRLELCEQELEELKERYRDVDEECEICSQYLREEYERCARLNVVNKTLQQEIKELNEKLHNASAMRNQDTKCSYANASVNTDEDWANLHSVEVDRMSFDRELEKNKELQLHVNELRCKNSELNATLTKMQQSAERAVENKAELQELEATKLELNSCKRELEEYKERYKQVDEECDTCGEYLKDQDEQICVLKEFKLEQLLEKEARSLNRGSAVEYTDASTETGEDLLNSNVERENTSLPQSKQMRLLEKVII